MSKIDRIRWEISDCWHCQMVAYHPEYSQEHPELCYQYCPYCGKPFTEKAWAELERKIGGNHERFTNIGQI